MFNPWRREMWQCARTACAVISLALFCCASIGIAAPPTVGGATVSGLPIENLRVIDDDIIPMMGSLAIHGADAMTWGEYSFWMAQHESLQSNRAATVLQSIYDRPSSRANFPSFFLNSEIATKLIENIYSNTPSDAAVLFWTSRLNAYSSDPQISLRPLAKGRLIYDMVTNALGVANSDPNAGQFSRRLNAALVMKKETDTGAERNDQTATTAAIFNASRPRLLTITNDVATYNAALTPLARLNWVIDQSAIPASATYDAETGLLSVSGTELIALADPDNDIDLSKLTLYGDGSPYALTTAPVEITNSSSFQVRLNAADRIALRSRFNRDGTASSGNVKYLLAAAPGWSAALSAAQPQPALTGTRITVVNNAPAILNIDRSDAATRYDAATDGVLLMRYLLGFRNADLIANARGNGVNLRDAIQIENHISASLALLDVDGDGQALASTDGVMILRRLLNPGAAIGNAAAMATLTANAKRGTRTDAEVVSAIDALKP